MIQFNPVGSTIQALKLELTRFFNEFGRFFYEKNQVYTKEEVDAKIQALEEQISQLRNELQ